MTIEPRGGVPAPTGPIVLVGVAGVGPTPLTRPRLLHNGRSLRRRSPLSPLFFAVSAGPARRAPAVRAARAGARRRGEPRAGGPPRPSGRPRSRCVRRTGASFFVLELSWSAAEPAPRKYNLAEITRTARLLRQSGATLHLDLPLVTETARDVPADLSQIAVRRSEAVAAARQAPRRADAGAARRPDAVARRGRRHVFRGASPRSCGPSGACSTAPCSFSRRRRRAFSSGSRRPRREKAPRPRSPPPCTPEARFSSICTLPSSTALPSSSATRALWRRTGRSSSRARAGGRSRFPDVSYSSSPENGSSPGAAGGVRPPLSDAFWRRRTAARCCLRAGWRCAIARRSPCPARGGRDGPRAAPPRVSRQLRPPGPGRHAQAGLARMGTGFRGCEKMRQRGDAMCVKP